MPLVNAKEILLNAKKTKTAVGAFNFTNLEQLKAILQVSENLNVPVIIQASESAINYIGLETLIAMVKAETNNLKSKVCLNLDHGKSFEICKRCIDAGFKNVMIDYSNKSFNENCKITKQVCEYAHKFNVTVEAELGALKGVEDNIKSSVSHYTNLEEAVEFVKLTNVDSLAVSIGTSHGAYKFEGESYLNISLLKELSKNLSVPLVLHGASMVDKDLKQKFVLSGGKIQNAKGVSKENLIDAINNGICKVNMDTDFRIAFTTGVRNSLKNKETFNLREYLTSGINEMKIEVEKRLKLLNKIN